MIPELAITQWWNIVPWTDVKQVEQDLIICRDLITVQSPKLNPHNVVKYIKRYIECEGQNPVYELYVSNIENKMLSDEFPGDTKFLLQLDKVYDVQKVYKIVKKIIINILDTEEDNELELTEKN